MAPDKLLPLLAAHLHRERERLGDLWLAAVRRSPEVPSAEHLSDAELTDHLPKIFDDLVRYLREQDGQGPRAEVIRASKDHGCERSRQGYHPGEVLRELGILHRLVALDGLYGFLREHRLKSQTLGPARDLVSRFFEDVAVASTERFIEEWAARLESANRRLAAIDASRLQLLRVVTHELGGFLQTLSLGLATALHETREVARREMLAMCDRNLADMGALLEELRDYSVLLAGGTHVEWETFVVRTFAEEVAAALQLHAQDAGVDLRLRIEPGLSEVTSDRRRLRQVIANLVSNALKYHNAARRDRWVELAFTPSGVDRWSIIVEDNGIGIAPENLEAIFTEFGRGTPPRGVQGTGLGLTITRHLAEILGGEVRVKSQPGQGSRFEVVLPVTPGSASPPVSDPHQPSRENDAG